jgi:hypothetical protein
MWKNIMNGLKLFSTTKNFEHGEGYFKKGYQRMGVITLDSPLHNITGGLHPW